MKLVKNIFIKIIWIILFILVAFNIYNFVSINILHKDLATINGYGLLEVVSGSMEPTIHVGDIIIINTNDQEYKKDDIITFYDVNGSFVTHRLVEINDKVMVTKGDANDSRDEEMNVDNIVGKMVFRLNGAGKLMASLKNPFVMLLIMIIGIVLCLLMSTDKNLIPKDLTEEEKAFIEYRKYYSEKPNNKSKKKEKKHEEVKQDEIINPIIIPEEAEIIGEIIEVSVEELEEQQRNEEELIREQIKNELRDELKEEIRRELKEEMQHKNKTNTNNKNHNKKNYNNKQHYYKNNKKNHKNRNNKNKGKHTNNKNNRK